MPQNENGVPRIWVNLSWGILKSKLHMILKTQNRIEFCSYKIPCGGGLILTGKTFLV